MGNQHTSDSFSEIRKTKFNFLKEQQCSLTMQLHDVQTQADLDEKLREVTDQIDHIMG